VYRLLETPGTSADDDLDRERGQRPAQLVRNALADWRAMVEPDLMESPQAIELRQLPPDELLDYLTAHSGLPGPRANLGLADTFAAVADRETVLRLASLDDEYLRFCGTEAIGRLVVEDPDDAALVGLLRRRAADASWRVREGSPRALQIIGDSDARRLELIVSEWMRDPNPYVRRAAIAAICEPRLLKVATTRKRALEACVDASESIVALPRAERLSAAVRNLRQALGYCWSVVIAADPDQGLPTFRRLQANDDPDLRWIVSSNLKKARLKRLL
jgi:hypothetical protein